MAYGLWNSRRLQTRMRFPVPCFPYFKLSEQMGKTALEFLQNYLWDKKMLLIFDNCEHVIGAAARLTHGY